MLGKISFTNADVQYFSRCRRSRISSCVIIGVALNLSGPKDVMFISSVQFRCTTCTKTAVALPNEEVDLKINLETACAHVVREVVSELRSAVMGLRQ